MDYRELFSKVLDRVRSSKLSVFFSDEVGKFSFFYLFCLELSVSNSYLVISKSKDCSCLVTT